MAAANIERRTVHIRASAKSSRFCFLLKNHKGFLSLIEEAVGECKAGWPGSEY
jgi:hypothetical protein